MKRLPIGLVSLVAVATIVGGCGSTTTRSAVSRPTAAPSDTTLAAAPSSPTARRVPAETASTPAGSPSTTAPATRAPHGVNLMDASAVATALLETTFTYNTNLDTSPFDAMKRSLVFYTPAEAAKVLAAAPTGSPGDQWIVWSAHKATTTVTVNDEADAGAPPDTTTAAYKQYLVQVTPHGTAGWTAAPTRYVCFVTLARPNATAPWQVSDLQVDL